MPKQATYRARLYFYESDDNSSLIYPLFPARFVEKKSALPAVYHVSMAFILPEYVLVIILIMSIFSNIRASRGVPDCIPNIRYPSEKYIHCLSPSVVHPTKVPLVKMT